MKSILIIACSLIYSQLAAQNSNITGNISDDKNSPLPYATVILKKAADSTIYKGEISDESGKFIFQNVPAGSYYLQTQSVGYSIFSKPGIEVTGSGEINLGNIKMTPSSNELKAVKIEAEKPFIERQADKMVVNVENSIVQAGSSAMEVFEKLPGVLVDQDGNIRLRGKQGVIVVINEKPTALSGQDLVNMLKGMSAANIQKVEIITNPSAKWDASGNSGIINIVMKKNKLDGYNGSASFTYGQGRYPKYNSALSFNFKKDRFNIFFNYSYSKRKGFNNLIIDRRFFSGDTLKETFLTNNYIRLPFETHNPRIGIDYSISDKTTISLLGNTFNNKFTPTTVNHTDIYGEGNIQTRSLDFSQSSDYNSFNYEINSQINHKFDTLGQSLVINLDYGQYENNSDQFNYTKQTDVVNNIPENIFLTGDQLGKLYLYSAKADYTKPLKNNFSIEGGVKSSLVKSDKDMRFYSGTDNEIVFDSARSSHFLYDENINAAYLSLTKKIGSLTLQAGLRAEQTVADGLQKLNSQTFDRNYFQLFPTAFINYEFGKNNINANIGRRINRPHYEQMNPFRRMIDHTTYAEGNPYLLPELTYLTEFSYSYNNTYFITLGYSHTIDNITDVLIQDAQTRTTIQSVVNLNEVDFYNLDFTFSKRLTKWWKTNTNLQGYMAKFIGTVNRFSIDQGKPSYALSCSNNFTITEKLSAELTVRYNYKNLYGVTTMRSSSNVSGGFQYSVFNKKGNITLNVTDAFWNAYPKGITEFGDVTEVWNSRRDTRVVNLGFSYNFGKGKTSKMRKNTGADEEKGRM